MLTGERPTKNLVSPSQKVEVDVRIDEMVLRALEKEPELRYQTAGEFQTVVETLSLPRDGQALRNRESDTEEKVEDAVSIPLSLRAVAYLFILGGLGSLAALVISVLTLRPTLDFGFLGIFVGMGLLKLRPVWRTCALIFSSLSLIGGLIFVVLIALNVEGSLALLGRNIDVSWEEPMIRTISLIGLGLLSLIPIWQLRVLTRANVRALFASSSSIPKKAQGSLKELTLIFALLGGMLPFILILGRFYFSTVGLVEILLLWSVFLTFVAVILGLLSWRRMGANAGLFLALGSLLFWVCLLFSGKLSEPIGDGGAITITGSSEDA